MDASLFPPKQHKIAWYGNIYSPASNTIEYTTRPLLIEFSNQYPHLFHFRHSPLDAKEKFVTIPEMIREYYYVLDIGGNGYSGRLKYLLFTNRPLFLVERRWIEYFHTDLQPYEHYIPIHANLSNLVEQALWAQQHAVECKRMALNALNFAKTNFTTENLSRRYREVIVDQCRYGPCIVATK